MRLGLCVAQDVLPVGGAGTEWQGQGRLGVLRHAAPAGGRRRNKLADGRR